MDEEQVEVGLWYGVFEDVLVALEVYLEFEIGTALESVFGKAFSQLLYGCLSLLFLGFEAEQMAIDFACHHDALMVWFNLQLNRLLEATLGFFLLRIHQILLINFEVIQPVLLYGDLRILRRILIIRRIDDLHIGPGVLVHADIVKDAKDIPIDELILLGTDSRDIEQIIITHQPISVDIHRNEAKKMNLLQSQREKGLQVTHLGVVIFDVLIIKKRG